MKYHEAADIFPLDEEHIPALAKDIVEHGLLAPIETLDGMILDGRRRFLACNKAGVEPQYVDVKSLVDDPISYVLSVNLHRRHLTVTQLGMCAGRATALREKLDDEAKGRQKLSKGRGKKGPANLPDLNKGDSRDALGKRFGISGRTASDGVRVARKGIPELQQACQRDEIAISTAARVSSRSPEDQRKFLANAKGKPGGRTVERVEPEPKEGEARGVGVIRANEAINCLKRIPKKDRLRKRGFQIVSDWIKANR